MAADLEHLERIAVYTRHDWDATAIRAAIAELTELREAIKGRTVSCEACNENAKRVAVLEEECRASRVFDRHNAKPIHRDNYERMIDAQSRLMAARRATDENGGLGA